MPAIAKIYNGTGCVSRPSIANQEHRSISCHQVVLIIGGDLQRKFLNRFRMLKACDKDLTEMSKIIRKANETLPNFKERWVSKSNTILNVPKLMQISSFMSSHKCPKLSKRFSDNIHKTVDEMLKRVDDYLQSEEAFCNTELPKGEFQRKEVPLGQWGQQNERIQ
ncbi:hypothetical protein Tco_1325607 [Tanacetum coccineum]